MKHFLILSGFLLGVTLLAPVARADDQHDKRYYDKSGKDYHVYDSQQDRAYRAYLAEQHKDYREFKKAKPAQQQEYFKWRHDHSDAVLKIEVR